MIFSLTDFFLISLGALTLFFYHLRMNQPRKVLNKIQALGDTLLADLNRFQEIIEENAREHFHRLSKMNEDSQATEKSLETLIVRAAEISGDLLNAKSHIDGLYKKIINIENDFRELQDFSKKIYEQEYHIKDIQDKIILTQTHQNALDSNLDNALTRINNEKNRMTEELTQEMKIAHKELETYGSKLNNLHSDIIAQQNKLSNVSDDIAYIAVDLSTKEEKIVSRIEEFGNRFQLTIEQKEIEHAEKTNKRLQDRLQEFEKDLHEEWQELFEHPKELQKWHDLLEKKIKEVQKNAGLQLTNAKKNVDELLLRNKKETDKKLSNLSTNTQEKLEEERNLLSTSLEELRNNYQKNLRDYEENLEQKIEESKEGVNHLADSLAQLRQRTLDNEEEIEKTFAAQLEQLKTIDDNLKENAKNLSESIDTKKTELEDFLGENLSSLENHWEYEFSKFSENMGLKLHDRESGLEKTMEGHFQAAKESWQTRLNEQKDVLNKSVHQIIGGVKKEYIAFFESRKSSFDSTIANLNQTKDNLTNRYSELEEQTRKQLQNLNQQIYDAKDQVTLVKNNLHDHKQNLLHTLNTDISVTVESVSQLNSRIDQVYNDQSKDYKRRITELSHLLENQEETINSITLLPKDIETVNALVLRLDNLGQDVEKNINKVETWNNHYQDQKVLISNLENSFQLLDEKQSALEKMETQVIYLLEHKKIIEKETEHYQQLEKQLQTQKVSQAQLLQDIKEYKTQHSTLDDALTKAEFQELRLKESLDEIREHNDALSDIQQQVQATKAQMHKIATNYDRFTTEHDSLYKMAKEAPSFELKIQDVTLILDRGEELLDSMASLETRIKQEQDGFASNLRILNDISQQKITPQRTNLEAPVPADTQRSVVNLAHEHKWSVSEISTKLNLSPEQVKIILRLEEGR